MNTKKTSWNRVHNWYNTLVGQEGHTYHQEVIFPNLLPYLQLSLKDRLLDIGCGEGVLSRVIPKGVEYVGCDASKELIAHAKKKSESLLHSYVCFDAMKPWPLDKKKKFTHAVCILALQNMPSCEMIFEQVGQLLIPGGRFSIVLNHPCFRIPRQSRWGFDEATKTQTRELFSYMSPQEIPIKAHPGKKESETTWSFHFPLSYYSHVGEKYGFSIQHMDEWVSQKKSQGSAKTWENRARKEFPLFLLLGMQHNK